MTSAERADRWRKRNPEKWAKINRANAERYKVPRHYLEFFALQRSAESTKSSTKVNTKKAKQPVARVRGRPRLGDFRVECIVPGSVRDLLMMERRRTGLYHTRVAANVLCEWAEKYRTRRAAY